MELYIKPGTEALTKAQFDLVEPIIVRMMNREISKKKAEAEIIAKLEQAGLPLVPKQSA